MSPHTDELKSKSRMELPLQYMTDATRQLTMPQYQRCPICGDNQLTYHYKGKTLHCCGCGETWVLRRYADEKKLDRGLNHDE